MLELMIALVLVFWLLGFTGQRGGSLAHLLLAVLLVLILVRALY
jgi:hypothetical protein